MSHHSANLKVVSLEMKGPGEFEKGILVYATWVVGVRGLKTRPKVGPLDEILRSTVILKSII